MDKIIITALGGIKAGMWQAIHGDDVKNRDIIRQDIVHPKDQVKIPGLLCIHMEKELAGVYLRIRAAAAGYVGWLFKYLAQAALQNLLNADAIRVFLPAVVIGAEVTDMKKVAQVVKDRRVKIII